MSRRTSFQLGWCVLGRVAAAGEASAVVVRDDVGAAAAAAPLPGVSGRNERGQAHRSTPFALAATMDARTHTRAPRCPLSTLTCRPHALAIFSFAKPPRPLRLCLGAFTVCFSRRVCTQSYRSARFFFQWRASTELEPRVRPAAAAAEADGLGQLNAAFRRDTFPRAESKWSA